MKFFKMYEIDEETYLENTEDRDYEMFSASAIKKDDTLYIAVNEENEDEIRVSMNHFTEEEDLI